MSRNKSKRPPYVKPEDVGFWEDDEFVFFKPFDMGGQTVKRLITQGMKLEPGITRDDVIHALINPKHMERLENE